MSKHGDSSTIDFTTIALPEYTTVVKPFFAKRLWSIQLVLPLVLLLSVITIASVVWSINYTQSQKGINSVAMIARNYALASLVQQVVDNNGRDAVRQTYEEINWITQKVNPELLYNRTLLMKLISFTMKASDLYSLVICFEEESVVGIRHIDNRYEEAYGDRGNWSSYIINIDTLERLSFLYNVSYYPTTRPWYQDTLAKNGYDYSPPFFAQTKFPPAFVLSYSIPVYSRTKKLVGVLSGTINLSLITNVLPTFHHEKNSVLFLSDKEGKLMGTSEELIYPPDPDDVNVVPTVFNASNPQMYRGMKLLNETVGGLGNVPNNRTVQVEFGKGKSRYSLFARAVTDTDGFFIIAVLLCKDSDILGSVYTANNICSAVCVCFIVLAVAMALLIGWIITRPLHNFSMEMKHIANMEFDGRLTSDLKLFELGEMKDCMNQMKQALRNFEAYVPSTVVKYIVRNKQQAMLGVVPRDLSILFVDIKDFTSIAERVDPNDLVSVMCTFFTSMSDIVHSNNGIVDKYVSVCLL
jgi:hypothetical protein